MASLYIIFLRQSGRNKFLEGNTSHFSLLFTHNHRHSNYSQVIHLLTMSKQFRIFLFYRHISERKKLTQYEHKSCHYHTHTHSYIFWHLLYTQTDRQTNGQGEREKERGRERATQPCTWHVSVRYFCPVAMQNIYLMVN